MKVLHLDTGRSLRGGQRQALLLVEGLGRQGVAQQILARGALLAASGGEPLAPVRLLRAVAWCDLIHAHDAGAHRWAALAAGYKPIVVSRRVGFPLGGGWLSRWKQRRATRWLAVSNYVRDQLVTAGVDCGSVEVIPDGLPVPASEPPCEPRPEPVVLVLGSDDRLKLGELAARACRLAGLPLLLTGDLESDLPRADVFLYLTASEGLGSALIRASFAKKAIVASDVGGVPEIVQHGRTGLLTPNNAERAAAALDQLRRDPSLARRCAEAAYRQAERHFRADIMVARTIDAYRRILASRSSE